MSTLRLCPVEVRGNVGSTLVDRGREPTLLFVLHVRCLMDAMVLVVDKRCLTILGHMATLSALEVIQPLVNLNFSVLLVAHGVPVSRTDCRVRGTSRAKSLEHVALADRGAAVARFADDSGVLDVLLLAKAVTCLVAARRGFGYTKLLIDDHWVIQILSVLRSTRHLFVGVLKISFATNGVHLPRRTINNTGLWNSILWSDLAARDIHVLILSTHQPSMIMNRHVGHVLAEFAMALVGGVVLVHSILVLDKIVHEY